MNSFIMCINIMEKSPGETKAEQSNISYSSFLFCFEKLKISYGALHLFAFVRQYCAILELYSILPFYSPLKSAVFKLRCDLCIVIDRYWFFYNRYQIFACLCTR